jgi:hypothetical protein
MRFLPPDLYPNDRTGIHRRNARPASVTHFFLFTHHQNLSAQLSGISMIVPPARRSVDADDPRPSVLHCNLAWQGVAP